MLSPIPVPWPCFLVVKKGSNARSAISGAIPVPVSVTSMQRYAPGAMPAASSSAALRMATVSVPPSGIASRALIARLMTAFSSCAGSTVTGQRSPGSE